MSCQHYKCVTASSWRTALALAATACSLSCFGRPPKESALLAQFSERKAALEEIRQLLLDEPTWRRVAEWGVRTEDYPVGGAPLSDPSRVRSERVVDLLKQAGWKIAGRSEGPDPDVCIGAWAAGWAGDTRHISFCSLRGEPKYLVASLDSDEARALLRSARREMVYRHVEGTWYLQQDW